MADVLSTQDFFATSLSHGKTPPKFRAKSPLGPSHLMANPCGAVGCTEPGAWQRLIGIVVHRGCSWHSIANLSFVLHCLPNTGANSFARSLVHSLSHVMARPISSFLLPWKPLTGESEYAKFLNSEALEIYPCHHTTPTQVRNEMAQKRWALRKRVKDTVLFYSKKK